MSEQVHQRAWSMFTQIILRVSSVGTQQVKTQVGISMADFAILLTLSKSPEGALRMGVLSEVLSFSPSRLSYLVSSLVDRKLVKKTTAETDGRGHIASITATGQVLCDKAGDVLRSVYVDLIETALTEEENQRLIDMLAHVNDRLGIDRVILDMLK
ncbi:MAG: MarR family winged helix-turn-helix transcriptional regulator [Actinomycetaceae bacterium]|nr:MarR family winged helix-turn-helix transcriptional regulator [Actinomycetaceae bacterium]